jgi:ligand-binding sensor domain-containing protein
MKCFVNAILLCGAAICLAWGPGCSTVAQDRAIGEVVSELDNAIFLIFQAKSGDFWFGTNGNGVYRYDGKTARHFTAKDGLSDSQIREIQEDPLGKIYFSTQEGGVFRFDGKQFEKLVAVKGEWKLEPDDIWFKGESLTNGPYRYDGKTLFRLDFPKHYLEDEYYAQGGTRKWSPYEVYKIYKDKRGHVWLGTSNFGLCRWDGKSHRWMYEREQLEVEGGGWFGLRSIFEDKSGAFWICNSKYRYQIEPGDPAEPTAEEKAKSLLRYKRKEGLATLKSVEGKDSVFFMWILEDKKGDLWLTTHGEGVYRYDGKKVTHYPTMAGDKVITLFSMYEDRQGDLWLGTHAYGAMKFNGRTFERFQLK